jgi:hypothetical protein
VPVATRKHSKKCNANFGIYFRNKISKIQKRSHGTISKQISKVKFLGQRGRLFGRLFATGRKERLRNGNGTPQLHLQFIDFSANFLHNVSNVVLASILGHVLGERLYED